MGFMIGAVLVGVFVYAFKSTWRATSPEARHARRVERVARRQDIEYEAGRVRLQQGRVHVEGGENWHFDPEVFKKINGKGKV